MNRCRKFTIIELLVVISIITILASIMLPALNKARVATYRTVCTSNLKQVGVGLSQYTIDSNCYLPLPASYGTNNYVWANALGPYLFNNYLSNAGWVYYERHSGSIMTCPRGMGEIQENNGNYWGPICGYTYLYYLGGLKLSRFTNTDSWIIVDNNGTMPNAYSWNASNAEKMNSGIRHGGFNNFLMLNGRVAPLKLRLYGTGYNSPSEYYTNTYR